MVLYRMWYKYNQWIIEEKTEDIAQEQKGTTLFRYSKNNSEPVDISFILYHYRSLSEDELIQTLSSLCKQEHLPDEIKIEYIILLDGVHLEELTLLKNIISKRPDTIIVETSTEFAGAGLMWNAGLQIASGQKICFTWTGMYWLRDSLFHLNRILEHEDADGAYGQVRYEVKSSHYSFDVLQPGQLEAHRAWIQSMNIIPLGYTLFKRNVLEHLKGFYCHPAMSGIVDWEFMLRASSFFNLKQLKGTPIPAKMSLCSLYKSIKFNVTMDELIRYMMKYSATNSSGKITDALLNEDISEKIQKIRHKKDKPLEIGIISDLKEMTQVQLCLLNYFEYLKHKINWRLFNEKTINPTELKGYDLVFFVRSRTDESIKAAQYCFKKDIKTVYILDDNWFWATETYPQLSDQIGVHTSFFQNFLLLITTVDYLLVYNDLLERDLRRYNNAVYNFPINVDLSHFKAKQKKETDKTVRIGYAGSNSKLPFFDPVFRALDKIMERYEFVNLYFKGIELPETFNRYQDRIECSPYIFDYRKYAKKLAEAHCHIMISPLGNTRYINSKCPNKYLEITASGAAGIYSKNELYEKTITDGYNGLLIDNEEEGWLYALEKLINDPSLRKEIQLNALDEVRKKYDTKVLVKRFYELLTEMIKS